MERSELWIVTFAMGLILPRARLRRNESRGRESTAGAVSARPGRGCPGGHRADRAYEPEGMRVAPATPAGALIPWLLQKSMVVPQAPACARPRRARVAADEVRSGPGARLKRLREARTVRADCALPIDQMFQEYEHLPRTDRVQSVRETKHPAEDCPSARPRGLREPP